MHAMVMGITSRARDPVGGAGAIAKAGSVIEADCARAATPVDAILIEDGKAVGVPSRSRSRSGHRVGAGAGETVGRLLPPRSPGRTGPGKSRPSSRRSATRSIWASRTSPATTRRGRTIGTMKAGCLDAIWSPGDEGPIPMLSSFPTLKDPAHDGPSNRHRRGARMGRWSSVAAFADGGSEESGRGRHSSNALRRDYRLQPRSSRHSSSIRAGTPLGTRSSRVTKGGFYGVETTPRRPVGSSTRARPSPGLFLKGQVECESPNPLRREWSAAQTESFCAEVALRVGDHAAGAP